MLRNIPEELKAYRQFVCWRTEEIEGKTKKIPVSALTGGRASVTDADTWSSYDHAVRASNNLDVSGIGFVLTHCDNFTFIDLDIPANDAERTAQLNIYNQFDSYAEISPSGKGLHIIVQGGIPTGVRRGSIEVYSSSRYMTLTGNVYRKAPVGNYQELLNELYEEMSSRSSSGSEDLEIIAAYSPSVGLPPEYAARCNAVWRAAASASNGKLFETLWAGNWRQLYPSQSEADMALMNILAFHTRDINVLKGLFRQSALGRRAKAQREDYINATIRRSFDQIVRPVEIINSPNFKPVEIENSPQIEHNFIETTPQSSANAASTSYASKFDRIDLKSLPALPGIVHETAAYLYRISRNPSAEFALTGALALMAGICGRAFNVSGTGLNLYMMLLAKTGTGKESVKTGLNKIVSTIAGEDIQFELRQDDTAIAPGIRDFISGSRFASGQGLLRAITEHPSCLFTQDEFGQSLERYHHAPTASNDNMIKYVLLEAYMSSGENSKLYGTAYSDKTKDTITINSPAVSLLGISTPELVFRTLTAEDIASGFIPRFIIVEKLDDVQFNYADTNVSMSKYLNGYITQLVEVVKARNNGAVQHVTLTEEAAALSLDHMHWCSDNVKNGTLGISELWNRANLNALRVAALLAVGVNYYKPVITLDQMRWAVDFVNSCVYNLVDKFDPSSGAAIDTLVGTFETRCNATIDGMIQRYITPNGKVYRNRFRKELHAKGIINYAYLAANSANSAAFQNTPQRGTATRTLKEIIQRLLDEGVLSEVSVADTVLEHKTTGKLYQIHKNELK
jgi:hypothetical protein